MERPIASFRPPRRLLAVASLALLAAAAWWQAAGEQRTPAAWERIAPGVFRSPQQPYAYALVDDSRALLIGGASDAEGLRPHGVTTVEQVLLTHHHRDSCQQAEAFVAQKIPVRATERSRKWLEPKQVARFWTTALPVATPGRHPPLRERTFGEFDYLVHPTGVAGIDYTLKEDEPCDWRGWSITPLAAPGHSRDHTAFVVRRGSGPAMIFCGDALASAGKLWTPYTTDWHHCFNDGLQSTAASLRRLADLEPAFICPEHGPVLTTDAASALRATADAADRAGELKSFEWYSKERLGQPAAYAFLAPEQVVTAGEKPWTKLSEHLALTGNTYALASRDGAVLLIDAYGDQTPANVAALKERFGWGPVETVVISHAHNDHYTGVHLLPDRNRWQLWTLDEVARPLSEPLRYVAPYIDARPLKIDRVLKDGERVRWHEYEFRVWHLPGQSWFTMGFEAEIDGRRCFVTADNFFHIDQFTGSGGWSGRNRSWPSAYAASARRVRDYRPEWVLAEHGGPFVYEPQDFERRIAWGDAAAAAADALCLSGRHRRDWDPQRVCCEPFLVVVPPGETRFETELVVTQPAAGERLAATIAGRGFFDDVQLSAAAPANPSAPVRVKLTATLRRRPPAGRHIFPAVVRSDRGPDPADVMFCLETP